MGVALRTLENGSAMQHKHLCRDHGYRHKQRSYQHLKQGEAARHVITHRQTTIGDQGDPTSTCRNAPRSLARLEAQNALGHLRR